MFWVPVVPRATEDVIKSFIDAYAISKTQTLILEFAENMGKSERAKERREKRLQEISLLRTIPYSDHQKWLLFFPILSLYIFAISFLD